jgi:hypothetical protein
MRGLAFDGMSTANFQALGAAKGKPSASAAASADIYVTRADSLSTANLQTLRAAKGQAAAPPAASTSVKTVAPAPAKSAPARPPKR